MASTSSEPFDAPNLRWFGLLLVYFLSLFFPAVFIGGSIVPGGSHNTWFSGHECLGISLEIGFAPHVALAPPLWANCCFFLGMWELAQERPARRAFWCGVGATLLSMGWIWLSASDLWSWIVGRGPFPYGPGYFLWLSCMFGLMLIAHLELRQQKREKTE